MFDLKETLLQNPIIAAIRSDESLKNVLNSNVKIVFVLYGDIMKIKSICSTLKANGKIVFLHVDLIDGIKCDDAGICFLKKYIDIDGIITTKNNSIKHAKKYGLKTIQRIFVIDSLSLKTGIKNICDNEPTAVEVLPGVANKIIHSMQSKITVPIIAGGLIKTKQDIIDSLGAGAIAVSTSDSKLWDL